MVCTGKELNPIFYKPMAETKLLSGTVDECKQYCAETSQCTGMTYYRDISTCSMHYEDSTGNCTLTTSNVDHDPIALSNDNPSPSNTRCNTQCDSDTDCGTFICSQIDDNGTRIPGCSGSPEYIDAVTGYDYIPGYYLNYCYNPAHSLSDYYSRTVTNTNTCAVLTEDDSGLSIGEVVVIVVCVCVVVALAAFLCYTKRVPLPSFLSSTKYNQVSSDEPFGLKMSALNVFRENELKTYSYK